MNGNPKKKPSLEQNINNGVWNGLAKVMSNGVLVEKISFFLEQ